MNGFGDKNLPKFPKMPRWVWPVGLLMVVALIAFAPRWVATLRDTHDAIAVYSELLGAANAQNVAGVGQLCTRTYLNAHPVRVAKEGGVIGLPRTIHPNFQAWRDRDDILLCPANRIGPVYRIKKENGSWKFDGPIGILRPGGAIVRSDEGEDGPP